MNVNEFFHHKVCINLDKRADRWERMRARFAEHNIAQVVRFPAVDGKNVEIPPVWDDLPGAYGCLLSHIAVVEQARADAKESVLIFEDDAVLAPEFNAKFSACSDQLPADWDMLYFGGIHGEPPLKVSGNVMKVTFSLSTYAYALKHTIYDGFIELNRQALTVLDENTRALQKRFNCYCFTPHLAWVEEDYSDVRDERTDLWWLKESLVLWGSEIDDILKKTVAIISYCGEEPASFRNLRFIVNYLAEKCPSMALLVVEESAELSLNPADFPPQSRLEFLKGSGSPNGTRALNRAFELFESSKDFFIFLDSNVFVTRDDIKANLLMCRDFDFANLCRGICDLDEQNTLRILNGDPRWDYAGTPQSSKSAGSFDSCCMITRRGMQIVSASGEDQPESRVSMKVQQLLRAYDSPNLARRLFAG